MEASNRRIKSLANANKHPSLKYLPFNLGEFKHFPRNSTIKISENRTLMPAALLACPYCTPASSSSYLATDMIDLQGLVEIFYYQPFRSFFLKFSFFLEIIFKYVSKDSTSLIRFDHSASFFAFSSAFRFLSCSLLRTNFVINDFLLKYQTICVPIGQLDMLEYSTRVRN